jgi:RNA polymerase sigma-70 factor (ECF subfamily)
MVNIVNDDLQLARKIGRGDERALEVFYERYADHLFAFIFHAVDGSQKDAEDIWQETLSTAVLRMGTYQGKSKLFTWLCAIARFKTADFYRKNGLQQLHLSEELLHKAAVDMAKEPLPENILEDRLVQRQVSLVMGRLPEKYAAVLSKRYFSGKSVQEIAVEMHVTYKAAESLLSRARRMFQEEFSKIEGESI